MVGLYERPLKIYIARSLGRPIQARMSDMDLPKDTVKAILTRDFNEAHASRDKSTPAGGCIAKYRCGTDGSDVDGEPHRIVRSLKTLRPMTRARIHTLPLT